MVNRIEIKGDFISLDKLLAREFGFAGQQLSAQTLELNPGLADAGFYLPHGTVVILPDFNPLEVQVAEPVISLFD